jgi:hypothetical protein
MSDITNKLIVLKLNASWLPVGYTTIKNAIVDLTGETKTALALDIGYSMGENGEWDFQNPTYMNPVKWEDWIKLEVRSYDLSIRSAKLSIRAPLILIAPNFNKMPMKSPRPTKDAIMKRDGNTCQYSGKKLSRKELNIDHIIPVSRGGKNTFENMVASEIGINRAKADKLPHEAGLKLIRTPPTPKSVPISTTMTELRHPTWGPFLVGRNKDRE